jgi:hypothetical protein
MSDVDSLSEQDLANARERARQIVFHARPKMKSLRRSGNALVVRGRSNPWFIGSVWLRVRLPGNIVKTIRIPNQSHWQRRVRSSPGEIDVRLFYSSWKIVRGALSQHRTFSSSGEAGTPAE